MWRAWVPIFSNLNCGAMIATIVISATLTLAEIEQLGGDQGGLMFLPLALASVGLLCSVGGVALVRHFSSESPEVALRLGTMRASALFILAAYLVILASGVNTHVWGAVIAGAVGGIIIGLVTEYYTGGPPVRKIARSGETGAATAMISGLAIGMQSVVVPLLTIAVIIFLPVRWPISMASALPR